MAKRKVELEVQAMGYVTIEVDEEKLKPLLDEKGDDFSEEILDEIVDVDLVNFGLGPAAPIDEAIDSKALLDALEVWITGVALKD